MSTYRVLYNGEVVGSAELLNFDSAMGLASGPFTPTPAFEEIRDVFRLFAQALRDSGPPDAALLSQYYSARDQLALSVHTAQGQRIEVGYVHIVDLRDFGETSCEVEVQVLDEHFFK